MPNQFLSEIPDSDPHHSQSLYTVTLLPLSSDGPAALAPEPGLGIAKVLLIKNVLAWRNAFNELTVRYADDLFACARLDGAYYDPIPKGADLLTASLEVHFIDTPEPHRIDLKPPGAFGSITPPMPNVFSRT